MRWWRWKQVIRCSRWERAWCLCTSPHSTNFSPQRLTHSAIKTPNAICGDLDSLRAEVQEYYTSVGVEVVHDPDQDSTDFGKCLDYIQKHYKPPSNTIFVYNALGGRVDHSFHSIHQLHLAISQESSQQRKTFLLSEEGITFLLAKGENKINLPKKVFGPACGVIPVGGSSMITTSGLVWDVADWETRFGGNVSTSNILKEEVVRVFTTEPVLFTVEVKAASFWFADAISLDKHESER